MKSYQFLNRFITLGLIFTFGFILLIGYWLIFPLKVLELSNVQLDRTEVNRGEHLQVSADYCKNTDKSAQLYLTFIDGIVYNVFPQLMDLEQGCHHTTLSVYIPKALPPGEFMLKGVFKYKLNPIREIEVNSLSGKFTIVK